MIVNRRLVAATLLCLVAVQAHAEPIPELDPGSMSGGLALAFGTLLMLFGRRR